ncbi:MAG: folylpolyglutamate synthase/dihydrofolate synthase family protein [Elusimicrobiota bacterium]
MTYREALRFLEERQETRWKLGLSRIQGLLAALGDPQDGLACVHVAGTNGKGTFAALLAEVLRAAGLRVGLFTSPHLREPLERIRVDGEAVPPGEFGRLIARARAAEPERASYFELVTAAAFLCFRERKVDVAVIEVGLGGRLDATNVLKRPLLSVITSIAIDHASHLGHTLAAIAGEKAGIVKRGVPCLCGGIAPEALAVIRERVRASGARMIEPRPGLRTVAARWEEGVQELETPEGRRLSLRLLGEAAARNASLALAAVAELRAQGLRIPEEAVARGFSEVRWPCRFEVVRIPAPKEGYPGRAVVLDGAHNPAAMEAFLSTWSGSPWSRQETVFIVGLLRDKGYAEIARMLAPFARHVVATQPPSPRALKADDLARALRAAGCQDVAVEPDPEAAWRAWERSAASAGVVCGSFYLLGGILGSMRCVPA